MGFEPIETISKKCIMRLELPLCLRSVTSSKHLLINGDDLIAVGLVALKSFTADIDYRARTRCCRVHVLALFQQGVNPFFK